MAQQFAQQTWSGIVFSVDKSPPFPRQHSSESERGNIDHLDPRQHSGQTLGIWQLFSKRSLIATPNLTYGTHALDRLQWWTPRRANICSDDVHTHKNGLKRNQSYLTP